MKKTALLTTLTALFLVSQADAQSCMANVKKNGLTVGTSPDYPPYESLNEKNEIVGFDIDLINAVAKKMGVKVKVVGQGFDGLIPALISKKIDVIAAGMTVTAERKKAVNFTLPYDNSANVIMARKENLKYASAASLAGKNVGSQIGTVQEKIVQDIKGANSKAFNLYTDAAVALQTRQIDAMVVDKTVADQFLKTYPDLRITGTLAKNEKAMAVRKDCGDVVNRMNAAIIEMRKNGELAAISKKWLK
ncbi:transporter substrate-binding domain-containing protein [Deinococcus antarcticus]|uniref:Transporter substrate-binding domain-containing protein n=1 Tax=Deinococcus antarcticus TaxID=1298767 RepID=A0ABV8AAN6_9DEIO